MNEEASEVLTASNNKRWAGAGGKLIIECTLCGRSLTQSRGSLSKPMRAHTGERQYACTTGGQAFSMSGHLTMHCALDQQ